MCSPSALSGSEASTRAFRLPSAAFPGPESRNFIMVDTMLRAVFTMARVLVTMLLQISCTPPGGAETHTNQVRTGKHSAHREKEDQGGSPGDCQQAKQDVPMS